jgi:4-amino-4-deoxy-L-arabinose transferase-like glycosyltransferase
LSRRNSQIGLLIFIVALVCRLAPVAGARHLGIALDDMFQYDMLARSLLAGDGYRWYAQDDLNLITRYIKMDIPPDYDPRGVRTSWRAPLYPLFLAGVYALSGLEARLFAARFIQAVLGALLTPGTYLLARRLGRSKRASHIASLIVALYPMLVLYPLALVTENLFGLLLLFSTLAIVQAKRARDWALAGLLLGAATLTRSIVIGCVLIAALWVWRKSGPRHAATMLASFAVLTVPWSVRNTLLHGRPMFIESSLGYNLYLGYHPQGTGTFSANFSLDLLTIMDDAERDARGRQLAWEFIRADPARVPYLAVRKLGYFWGLEKRAPMYFYSNNMVGHWPPWLLAAVLAALCAPLVTLLPAAIVGASNRPWNRVKTLVLLMAGYYIGVHMLILAEDRFHLALVPFMAALAGPPRFQSRWQRLVAAALIVLALANWGWELARDWPMLAQLFSVTGHMAGFTY